MGPSAELTEWLAFAAAVPFGEEAMDWRFARLAAAVLNRLRWDKDVPVLTPADLMPDPTGELKEQRRQREQARHRPIAQRMSVEEYRERRRRAREGEDE